MFTNITPIFGEWLGSILCLVHLFMRIDFSTFKDGYNHVHLQPLYRLYAGPRLTCVIGSKINWSHVRDYTEALNSDQIGS